ncbi:type VII secretion-associated serine protease mycosin [Streptomyces sp. NPDC002994]|uniref:type VII secretion-associated serine protease mycosin n=1 Tax=Streptomyces sp. NPDC002994 TaxID=3154441 RepID=UPI0033B3061F
MGVKRVWSATGVVALTGALLLTSAPTASADYIRDKQWALVGFDAETVWAESQGAGVTVAVVDTGVNGSHPDLTGQVLNGKDFSNGGTDPQLDATGHGTHVASLIAGHGHGADGSAGVIGLAPKAKILPVRAAHSGDNGYEEERWARGIRYAVDHGAKVINLSFGTSSSPSSDTAKAVSYAQGKDVVVVASAGNDGVEDIEYPARLPGVVAVGAIDESRKRWEDSNYGPGLTLMAPGANIVGADHTIPSGYSNGSGTSDATAYVSAAAALVRSKFPDLTAGQVINRLVKSATFLDHKAKKGVPDEEYGYGIIRPNKALRMDIPAGPKAGPLPQAPSSTSSSSSDGAPKGNDEKSESPSEEGTSSGTLITIGAGVAAVVVLGIVIAVILNRRNRGGGGPTGSPGSVSSGLPTQNPSYSPYSPAPTPHNPGNANPYQQP